MSSAQSQQHGDTKRNSLNIVTRLPFVAYSLSGGELFDRVGSDDYKMSEAEAINYMRQLCEGLKHCHEHNIVHLDIKVSGRNL